MTPQNTAYPSGKSPNTPAANPGNAAADGGGRLLRLGESRRFQHAILESIEDGIIACDRHGRLTLFNQGTRHSDTMPDGMKGQELATRVRAVYPSAKVLHCSGYPQTTLLGNDSDQPFSGHLPKPYKAETLARKVRQLLDR